jgi:hypothetical protein
MLGARTDLPGSFFLNGIYERVTPYLFFCSASV